MINEQEYKEIKLIGETIGYLLENNLDNLEDNYELKSEIIQASVSYSMSQDPFRLRGDLNKINISTEVKEKIIQIINNLTNLSGEKKEIYYLSFGFLHKKLYQFLFLFALSQFMRDIIKKRRIIYINI